MTDNATPDGIVRPQSVIGPITLGLNNGNASIALTPDTVLTPADLKLAGPIDVVAITLSAQTLVIETSATPIVITGISGGTAPAIAPGTHLVSIARTPANVVVNVKAAGHATAIPFAAGAGNVTVSVTSANAI